MKDGTSKERNVSCNKTKVHKFTKSTKVDNCPDCGSALIIK